MRVPGRGLVGVAMLLGGCGSPEVRTAEDDQPPPGAHVIEGPAAPVSLADVAPGDTAAILALIQGTMRDGDAAAAALVSRDTLLEAGEGLESPRLRLWLQDGRPVKLVATEPNLTDRIAPETMTWFRLGEIAVLQHIAGIFLFDGDGIVFAADQALVPVPMEETLRMTLERELVDSVKARLAVFGVRYP